MASVALIGSRFLPADYQPLVSAVVGSYPGHTPGAPHSAVITTCGEGACAMVRQAAPSAFVFSAGAYRGHYVARLVQRGVAMVRYLAAQPSPLMVGFVTKPCPARLVPTTTTSKAWSGHGSGSWAELAFAAGHGITLEVFWCAPSQPQWPTWWGNWQPAGFSVAPAFYHSARLLPSLQQAAF